MGQWVHRKGRLNTAGRQDVESKDTLTETQTVVGPAAASLLTDCCLHLDRTFPAGTPQPTLHIL